MSEESLFHAALSKPPSERSAFLDHACEGRPELREAVAALLGAHESSGNALDQPAMAMAETIESARARAEQSPPVETTTDYHPEIEPGLVIANRYELREKIGEGGMGEVWVAKQTEPVKRSVALKLIKSGMDSKAVLSRFEQERQALAMMDHPNIARVLDGGLTPTRQPFWVMELVNGLPLTTLCDEEKLRVRDNADEINVTVSRSPHLSCVAEVSSFGA